MPYIDVKKRCALDQITSEINALDKFGLSCAGDLNYLFTFLANTYLNKHGVSYQKINDVIGALEGAKLELYRRTAAPYEDIKLIQNGDVIPTL